MSTKRPGESLEGGTPAKVQAGDRADNHSEVQHLVEQASDVSIRTARDRRNRDERLQTVSRPAPEETNFIRSFAANFLGPSPCHPDVYIRVPAYILDDFAKVLRSQILNLLYPDGEYDPNGVISEDDWVHVVRYILKSRVDHVYSCYSGRRPTDRVPLVRILVPRSLAMLINGIGVKAVFRQNFSVCPEPEPPPVDKTMWVISHGTHVRMLAFSRLITAASQRGLIFTSQISGLTEGTGWWLLRAATLINRNELADVTTQSIIVWAQFPEWTPADGLLAAMGAIKFSGKVLNCDEYLYKLESITDAVSIRASFCTQG